MSSVAWKEKMAVCLRSVEQWENPTSLWPQIVIPDTHANSLKTVPCGDHQCVPSRLPGVTTIFAVCDGTNLL